MLQLIWAFINVGAFLFFIITALRAIKLVSEKYGLAATLILIIGGIGIMCSRIGSTSIHSTTSNNARFPYVYMDRSFVKDQYFTRTKIKDNWISKIEVMALMGKYKDNDSLVAVEAKSMLQGFSSGYNWEPHYVEMTPVQGTGQFRYFVNGTEKWSLIGFNFYSVSRNYDGVFFPVKSGIK